MSHTRHTNSRSLPSAVHGRRYASVSLGQGQEPIAEQRLADFHKRGGWLLLQNIHLTIDWTTTVLDARIDKLSEGAHPDFRYAHTHNCVRPALHDGSMQVAGQSDGRAPLLPLGDCTMRLYRLCLHG